MDWVVEKSLSLSRFFLSGFAKSQETFCYFADDAGRQKNRL